MTATIEPYATKTGQRLYSVRWRDAAHRQHRKRGFARKRDAADYAARITASLSDGSYTDPAARRILVDTLGPRWITNHAPAWKAKYRDTIEAAWRNHVQPRWGQREIGAIARSEVQAWVAQQYEDGASVTVTNRNLGILKGIMDDAVADGLITRNPCAGITRPKRAESCRTYLTVEQLLALADAAGDNRAVILTLGFCGLRWGELAGLRVGKVDFDRKRIKIDVTWVRSGNKRYEDLPKNYERREVPMPDVVAEALAAQCAGKQPDDLVFTNRSGAHIAEQKRSDPKSWYARALAASGVPSLTCHDLRHTAASIAVSAGANVKALQRMLGHKSAAMTLDRYAGLFDSDLDSVALNINDLVSDNVNRMIVRAENRGHTVDTK